MQEAIVVEVLTAPRVLLGRELVRDGWVVVDDGRIREVGDGSPPAPVTSVLSEGVLAPGLIDLQINGAFGHDFADAELAGWRETSQRLLATGVTSFVPTIITAPIDSLVASLQRYRELRADLANTAGARSLGMHVEAVFLAPSRRGAHREDLLLDPAPQHLDRLLDAAGDALAYLTMAPERPGGLAAIERLVAAGVRVSIGHSDADEATARAAVDAGATLVTHLFNAQRGLHHRDAGVVGVALSDPRLTVGLIVDRHHVGDTAVRVAFGAAASRIALVTDAIAAMGMPPGDYDLGGDAVRVRSGEPPVRSDGTLAGSVVRLDDAVSNTIACGIDPTVALLAATRTPADALGRSDLGRIEVGSLADLVWLDEGWRTRATWLAGELAYGETSVSPGAGGEAIR